MTPLSAHQKSYGPPFSSSKKSWPTPIFYRPPSGRNNEQSLNASALCRYSVSLSWSKCLRVNILFRAQHIPGHENSISDALSRFQMARFLQLDPGAEQQATPFPAYLWKLWMQNLRGYYLFQQHLPLGLLIALTFQLLTNFGSHKILSTTGQYPFLI